MIDENPLFNFVVLDDEDEDATSEDQENVKSRHKKAFVVTGQHAELAGIRKTLGMRKQDFSAHLDIGVPRLSSYLSGRTASVPTDVMERARALLKDQKKIQEEKLAKFSVPMSDIVAGWKARLGVRTDLKLANLLGVTVMTIHRWKTNKSDPDLTALVRYDTVVEHLAYLFEHQKSVMAKV